MFSLHLNFRQFLRKILLEFSSGWHWLRGPLKVTVARFSKEFG